MTQTNQPLVSERQKDSNTIVQWLQLEFGKNEDDITLLRPAREKRRKDQLWRDEEGLV